MTAITALAHDVRIPTGQGERQVRLDGTLIVPVDATGLVIFAHGAGSSRFSPRNVAVAESLRAGGRLGTLLFDLLTEEEDLDYRLRFDIALLTERLLAATRWATTEAVADGLKLGLFGASTGAAAALRAAARVPEVAAVVSRGGRPDLATDALPDVSAPTLLIVGGHDPTVIELNRLAFERLGAPKEFAIVPGATHLFEEPGALEQVSALALEWFERYLS